MEWESKGEPATLWIWERLKLSLKMLVPRSKADYKRCCLLLYVIYTLC